MKPNTNSTQQEPMMEIILEPFKHFTEHQGINRKHTQ